MSEQQQGPGWWQASDGNWYPPQQAEAKQRVTWWGWVILAVGVGVAAAAGLRAVHVSVSGESGEVVFDAHELERTITDGLARRNVSAVVSCPSGQAMERGAIFDCRASVVGVGDRLVRVTQDDGRGHVHWEVTDQSP